jgi:flagellar M-ring protein FliF
MDFYRNLQQQLRQIWKGMNRLQKLVVILAGAVSLGLLGLVGYWYVHTDYQVFRAGLSAEEAAAITAKLQESGVSYKLAAGGTAILVPAEQIAQLRLTLAGEELGKGTGGMNDLMPGGIAESPSAQHFRFLHALQNELARTIMQIDPVVAARVHIVRPDSSPFIRDKQPTTASVMLKLRPGTTLSRNASQAIAALVARSVEGLTRENVTLVDAHGHLLSEMVDPETGLVGSHIEHRRELENYLATKAESMLSRLLGPGRAVVRVTADLNTKRYVEKKEIVNPEGRVPITEETTTKKLQTTGTTKGSAAGTTSNLGKPSPGTGGPVGSDNREETSKTNYAYSKTIHEMEDKLGTIERLTIAALVDLAKPGEESGSTESTALSMADVQEIIKKAVGYKTGRDEIQVSQVHMPDPNAGLAVPDAEWERQQQFDQTLQLVRNGSLGVMALAGVLLVWVVWRNKKAVPVPGAATEAPSEAQPLAAALEQDPAALGKVLLSWLNESAEATRKAA